MICNRIPTREPLFATTGNTCIDIRGERNGQPIDNKCDGRFAITNGGCPWNAGRYGPANGIPTAVIGVQSAGWAALARALARAEGLLPILAERDDDGPALSTITPNHQPGKKDVLAQRMQPLRAAEMTAEMVEPLGSVRAFLAGLLPPCPETFALLHHFAALTPQAYKALIPHPAMLGRPEFPLVAVKFDYVQSNFEESKLIPGAANDLTVNARRLAFLLDESVDFAITNGDQDGLLFAEREWRVIKPIAVPKSKIVDETTAGDVFAAAWILGRAVLGLSIDEALAYAVEASADAVTQTGVRRPLAYRKAASIGVVRAGN